ncbi:MAG: right-handed parallel beta-helix repeat-containing protein [Thermoflexales bacterium]|nr:right-handed parallel beta-helix repeat-containing protein [Thermoflexales bacterium]
MKLHVLTLLCVLGLGLALISPARATNTTYYVSMTDGLDTNTGLSAAAPFKTIAKVNALNLQPGDHVLFKCGDTWRSEMLRIEESGTADNPIEFGAYPEADCASTARPTISGAQPITGWTTYAGSIYVADLTASANSPYFPVATTDGINQLFRGTARLGIGRWPNRDAADGGYSTIDAQPTAAQFTDHQLPAVNWTGATAHIKGMRWYILNRTITADSANTLTVNANLDCWGGNCTGWGFWLDNHLATLNQDGEWYYDTAARKVYLYSTQGAPVNIEGSVVIKGESSNLGGIILGKHLQQHVSHIVIDGFNIVRWFDNGLTTPVNLEQDENADIVIRNNSIAFVDSVGINLATWVWNANANGNGYNGWRGGRNLEIINNTIVWANHMGINSYARQSLIEGNRIEDIAWAGAVGQSGMGCSITAGGGQCTEDGDGIRLKVDQDGTYSGNTNVIRYNSIARTGYNGLDVFGADNVIDGNLIASACVSKGDCGGIRTFGGSNLATTTVRNLTISRNTIADVRGNTDGARSDFDALFGFGLYIDHNSSNVTASDNTVLGSTVHGILYQDSTGAITGNTLFNNAWSTALWANQIEVTGNSSVSAVQNNLLFALPSTAGTLSVDSVAQIGASDNNHFYHAVRAAHISAPTGMALWQWRAASGQDAHSTELISSTLTQAEIFTNPAQTARTLMLSKPYVDLNGNSVLNTLTLPPFTSKILRPDLAPMPRLTISGSAPTIAHSGEPITTTFLISNQGILTATNLLITNTLPNGAVYVTGGTRVGNVISWTVGTLAPSASTMVSHVVTATTTLINSEYRVNAAGGYSASGGPIVTLFDPVQVYLPLLRR